ncbi:hypothetical protein CP533_3103, partial [Ophiocordyceps camponoti-saundersi (nom. inval.)]
MLPSMRHFLKVIDLYDEFNARGFTKKVVSIFMLLNGAAFRIHPSQPDAQLDFLAAGGPDSHAWNVIRSEADEILFKHAVASGAHAFDNTKVDAIQFADGVFRKFNSNLKNMASWGYWKGSDIYGSPGTRAENMPYFETLQDASGWCWHIPLHDGTHSVGIVLNQDLASKKKHELGSPQTKDFYLKCLEQVPRTSQLLSQAKLVSDIKSASDWSYCASAYAYPYVRIIGDAGCFIDPYFSS